jgi:hypothetical protein
MSEEKSEATRFQSGGPPPPYPFCWPPPGEVQADIGQAEAWVANLKATYDAYQAHLNRGWQSFDTEESALAREAARRRETAEAELIALNREAERNRERFAAERARLIEEGERTRALFLAERERLAAEAERTRDTLLAKHLRDIEVTTRERTDLHLAYVTGFSKDNFNSTAQIQRQSDVGAGMLFNDVAIEAIQAALAETVQNTISAAMQKVADAMTVALKEYLAPSRGGTTPTTA